MNDDDHQEDIRRSVALLSDLHSNSNEVLTNAAKQLSQQLANNKPAAKKLVRGRGKNQDSIQSLIKAIREKPRFGNLINYSIACLANLCVDDLSAMELIDSGVIQVLKDVLKTNPFNEELQRATAQCLANIGRNQYLVDKICEEEGIDLIFESLTKHHDPITHEANASVIIKFSKLSSVAKSKLMEIENIRKLEKVMVNNMHDDRVLASMIKIVNFMAPEKEFLAKLSNFAIPELVIDSLAAHPGSTGLVRQCIEHFNAQVEQNNRYLDVVRNKGGIDSAIAAMELNFGDENILKAGAVLLNNLSREEVGHLIKATRINESDPSFLVAKISNLALVEKNIDFIIKENGVEIFKDAMKFVKQTKDEEKILKITESSIRGIGRLCNSSENIRAVVETGCLDLVFSVAEEYKNSPEIVGEALRVFADISKDRAHSDLVMKKVGLKYALSCLEKFPDSERVAHAVFDLLLINAKLSSAAVRKLVEKEGGVEIILASAEKHLNSSQVLLSIYESAYELMKGDASSIQKFYKAGILDNIRKALEVHPENAEISLIVLKIIDEVVGVEEVALDIRRNEDLLKFIGAAIEKSPVKAEFMKFESNLVSKISPEEEFLRILNQVKSAKTALLNGKPQDADKIIEAMNNLSSLAQISGHSELILKNNSVDDIIEILKISNSPSLSAACLNLLLNAGLEFAHKDDILIAFMSLPPNILDDEFISMQVVSYARKNLDDEGAINVLCSSGAIQQLLRIALLHSGNEGIVSDVAVTLAKIHRLNPDVLHEIHKMNGEEILLQAAFTHLGNSSLLLQDVALLNQLMDNLPSRMKLFDAGVLKLIAKALKAYPEHADIVSLCNEMLSKVLENTECSQEIQEAALVPVLVNFVKAYPNSSDCLRPYMEMLESLVNVASCVVEMEELHLSEVMVDLISENDDAPISVSAKKITGALKKNKNPIVVKQDKNEAEKAQKNIKLVQVLSSNLKDAEEEAILSAVELLSSLSKHKVNAEKLAETGTLLLLKHIVKEDKKFDEIIFSCTEILENLLNAFSPESLRRGNVEELISLLCDYLLKLYGLDTYDSVRFNAMLSHLFKLMSIDDYRYVLIKLGHFERIANFLITYQENIGTVTLVIQILALFSHDSLLHFFLLKGKYLKVMLKSLSKFGNDEKFIKEGIHFIGSLCLHENVRIELFKQNVLAIITDQMKVWIKNANVIISCNYMLANFSCDSVDAVSHIMRSPALQLVLTSMTIHTKAVELLEYAAAVVVNLCYQNVVNKEQLAKYGTAEVLVDLILRNYNQPALLISAIKGLGTISFHKDNVLKVINDGAAQSIVAGMTVHVQNLLLIQVALGVMTNLAADASEDILGGLVRDGALQAICEVAKAHTNNAEVQLVALSSLTNLLYNKNTAELIIRQQGIEAVVETMKYLKENHELMVTCIMLLSVISTADKYALKIIKTSHAIDEIIFVMMKYQNDVTLITDAVRIFYRLACSKENCNALAKSSVVDTLTKLAFAKVTDLAFFCEVLRALAAFVRSELISEQIANRNLDLIVQGIRLHIDDDLVCELALALICNMSCFQKASKNIGSSSLISLVIVILKSKRNQQAIVLKGIKAFQNLAHTDDFNRNTLKREGAIEIIQDIQKLWINDSLLEASCKSAINYISNREKKAGLTFFLLDEIRFDGERQSQSGEVLTQYKKMLVSGRVMTKHSYNASPHSKLIFVSGNLKRICWRDQKKQNDKLKFIEISEIHSIQKGRCSPQLQRRNAFGNFYADEDRCFACFSAEKNLSLECESKNERDDWVNALSMVKKSSMKDRNVYKKIKIFKYEYMAISFGNQKNVES